MLEAKSAKSPSSSGSKLSKFDGTPLPDPTEYRQIVGALQYCTLTSPDISFSVNQLCQHMHAPTSTHWSAAKRVLRYLKSSVDHGLHYTKGPLHLFAYCDSDRAGDPDDRRSTSGFAVFLGRNLVSWSAKKQPIVSRSSTEAEYRALAITTAEMFWLRMLLKDIHVFLSTTPTIWCDNVSALALASNRIYHARTKHIEVDYHFVREKVLNQDVLLRFISTDDQVADVFTKGLGSARFVYLRLKLMVIPSPISLRGGVRDNPAAQRLLAVGDNTGSKLVAHHVHSAASRIPSFQISSPNHAIPPIMGFNQRATQGVSPPHYVTPQILEPAETINYIKEVPPQSSKSRALTYHSLPMSDLSTQQGCSLSRKFTSANVNIS
jgi:hypothetical protein